MLDDDDAIIAAITDELPDDSMKEPSITFDEPLGYRSSAANCRCFTHLFEHKCKRYRWHRHIELLMHAR